MISKGSGNENGLLAVPSFVPELPVLVRCVLSQHGLGIRKAGSDMDTHDLSG